MISPADIAHVPLLNALPHALRSRMITRAADLRVNAGEWIAHEGDLPFFWILLSGEVEIVKTLAGVDQQMTTFDPGEYFGEIPLMISSSGFANIRAISESRLMRVEPADFHLMATSAPEAAALLAESLVRRVNYLSDAYASANFTQATIIGDRYDFACHDLRDFLSRNQINFEWLDPANPSDVPSISQEVIAQQRFPAVVLADGRKLYNPSTHELAKALGLQVEPKADVYDVVIIGGGPAGLASAVYGGSEGLTTMMIEREAPGGQAGTSSRIENYLGFPGGVSGNDLANRALLQAKRFGTEILVTRNVTSIQAQDDLHVIHLDGDERVHTKTIVLATGVVWRALQTPGAQSLVGRGVYYGAAKTEALGMRGKDVFLIGGEIRPGKPPCIFELCKECDVAYSRRFVG